MLPTHWLSDWLTHRLSYWLNDWSRLANKITDTLNGWLTDWLTDLPIDHSLADWLTEWLAVRRTDGWTDCDVGKKLKSWSYSAYHAELIFPIFMWQVWVAKSSLKERLEDVPIPGEVNNLLEEIYFEDEITRTRCRGWLVLKSRRHLKRDILFPGCELDCRFIVHERRRKTKYFLS